MRYVIKEKFFQITKEADITDDSGQVAFHVDRQLLSLHDRVILRDLNGT